MMIVREYEMWGVRFVSIEWVLLIRYSVYVEMFDNQSAISPFSSL